MQIYRTVIGALNGLDHYNSKLNSEIDLRYLKPYKDNIIKRDRHNFRFFTSELQGILLMNWTC